MATTYHCCMYLTCKGSLLEGVALPTKLPIEVTGPSKLASVDKYVCHLCSFCFLGYFLTIHMDSDS